ncbi:MAG: hypothetical protein AB7P40_03130 [Chloroflexota bacterium]
MESEKKQYTSPMLIEYGRMEHLTRGPLGGTFDAIIGKAIGIGSVSGGIGDLESWYTRSG